MSKVAMQDIADALGISRVTVWKALNNQPGVSKELRENIIKSSKELGYLKVGITEPQDVEERNISLIVSRPDSSTFWTNIIHRMAQELSLHNINLMYTYVPFSITDNYTLPSVLTNGTVQGAIILNIYDAKMMRLINDLKIPKVFLDTVPEIDKPMLNGDLFLIEGDNTIYEITKSVIEKGFNKIGFLGDISYARTNLDRFKGFCRCMHDHNLEINEQICLTHSIDIFSYSQELSDFLDSLQELPEAFVCSSDYIAHFLKFYFLEHPYRIPNGIMITGFDGSNEYSNIDGLITTADVNTGMIGKRLSMQMMYRMEQPDAPYELTYISPKIIYRKSILYP